MAELMLSALRGAEARDLSIVRESSAIVRWESEVCLEDLLRSSMVRPPGQDGQQFLPRNKLEQAVTPATVRPVLLRFLRSPEQLERALDGIFTSPTRRKLFAILVLIEKAEKILDLIDLGLWDPDLPMAFGNSFASAEGSRKDHEQLVKQSKFCKGWSPFMVESFNKYQWRMLAPYFSLSATNQGKVSHYRFEDSAVLPFIEDGRTDPTVSTMGGFGSVWRIKIHPEHHNFYPDSNKHSNPFFAIKGLHSPNELEFRKEVSALERFADGGHPNLIRLMATFEHKRNYFLLFPWAEGNLMDLWRKNPKPDMGNITVWFAKQITGIAQGLQHIHRPIDHSLDSKHEATEIWGRHGDIKPQNILWCRSQDDSASDFGTLKICDFGQASFHRKVTMAKSNPVYLAWTPTYRPPESDITSGAITQSVDIWSLGCLLTEAATWLLLGWEGVDQFATNRVTEDTNKILDDKFYIRINGPDGVLQSTIKPSVKKWLDELHAANRCSGFLHDFLRLIEDGMLVVDDKARYNSETVARSLLRMEQKCGEDSSYYRSATTSQIDINTTPRTGIERRVKRSHGSGVSKDSFDGRDSTDTLGGDQTHSSLRVMTKKLKQTDTVTSYSCPFRKRNPVRFNVRDHSNCALKPHADISQVKRHISSHHKAPAVSRLEMPFRCGRCLAGFSTSQELNIHLRVPSDKICALVDAAEIGENPEDGVRSETEKTLTERKLNHQVLDWESLWRVLFPMDNFIPSGEYECVVEDHEVYRRFQDGQVQCQDMLSSKMKAMDINSGQMDDSRQTKGIWDFFQSVISHHFDRRAHSTSPSARVTPRKTRRGSTSKRQWLPTPASTQRLAGHTTQRPLAPRPTAALTTPATSSYRPAQEHWQNHIGFTDQSANPSIETTSTNESTLMPTDLPPGEATMMASVGGSGTQATEISKIGSIPSEAAESGLSSCEMCASETTDCWLHGLFTRTESWGQNLDLDLDQWLQQT